jgi:hypothetical protein
MGIYHEFSLYKSEMRHSVDSRSSATSTPFLSLHKTGGFGCGRSSLIGSLALFIALSTSLASEILTLHGIQCEKKKE